MAELKKEFTTKTLLEKIPAEKGWAITAKYLLGIAVLQGEKKTAPEMCKDEGILAPVLGVEKWIEINVKIYGEGFLQLALWFKEMFNIPVEDAIGYANLAIVTFNLAGGPGLEFEYIEKTPERVVTRYTKCPEERIKKINPKLTGKLTKAMPFGDPYCEDIVEFKEE